MPLNRQQRAAQDLTEKLELEQNFIPRVRNLFNRVADDFYQSMLNDGVPPSMTNWQSFFEELLMSHYQATSDVFSRRMRDQLGVVLTEDEEESINTALAIFFANEASESSNRITATNENQASEAVQRARSQELSDVQDQNLQPYDAETRANVATNVFRNLLLARVTTIATTETQAAAEASKFTEAEVANFKQPTINALLASALNQENDKTWTAILDSVTRDTHVDADGQTVPASGFFIVGGYRMRFPGDRSAPIEEWINCRCCSVYTMSDDALMRRLGL